MRNAAGKALALLSLAVLAVDARNTRLGADQQCVDTCKLPDRKDYMLIRGEDQVKLCEKGYYCDCKKEKKTTCWGSFAGRRLDEDTGSCELNFDCQAFFDKLSTTTAAPATTSEPAKTTPEPVKTTPEALKTTLEPVQTTPEPAKTTPEPAKTTPEPAKTTPEPAKTTPEPAKTTQEPVKTTPVPDKTTPQPAPPTSAPDLDQQCINTCKLPDTKDYMLIRGEDQVKLCNDGDYCDCKEEKKTTCWGAFLGRRLDEDKGTCELNFDCQAFFDRLSTTTAAPATTSEPGKTTPQPAPPTSEPVKTTAQPVPPTSKPIKTTPQPAPPTAEPVKTTPRSSEPTSQPPKTTVQPAPPTSEPEVKSTSQPAPPTSEPVVKSTSQPAPPTSEPRTTSSKSTTPDTPTRKPFNSAGVVDACRALVIVSFIFVTLTSRLI